MLRRDHTTLTDLVEACQRGEGKRRGIAGRHAVRLEKCRKGKTKVRRSSRGGQERKKRGGSDERRAFSSATKPPLGSEVQVDDAEVESSRNHIGA